MPQFPPARSWCVTWNNPFDHLSEGFLDAAPPCLSECPSDACAHARPCYARLGACLGVRLEALPHFRGAVFQVEQGDSGTPHVQGYVEFAKPVRPAALIALCGGLHVGQRQGTPRQAADYCRKPEGRLAGPWHIGAIDNPAAPGQAVSQGSRTDLHQVAQLLKVPQRDLRSVALEHPSTYVRYHRGLTAFRQLCAPTSRHPPVCLLFYGPPGTGKSRLAHSLPSLLRLRLFSKPVGSQWWDGYDNHEIVLYDEFNGYLPLCELLVQLDRYPCQVPIKGGHAHFNAVRLIVIATNYHPSRWYDWASRREQYPALARRIQHVVHFPRPDEPPVFVRHSSFFNLQPVLDDGCAAGVSAYRCDPLAVFPVEPAIVDMCKEFVGAPEEEEAEEAQGVEDVL